MNIIDKRKRSVKFEELAIGEVFICSSRLFIKTDSSYCDDNGDYDNTVCLEDGKLNYFECDNIVLPVDCELIIK